MHGRTHRCEEEVEEEEKNRGWRGVAVGGGGECTDGRALSGVVLTFGFDRVSEYFCFASQPMHPVGPVNRSRDGARDGAQHRWSAAGPPTRPPAHPPTTPASHGRCRRAGRIHAHAHAPQHRAACCSSVWVWRMASSPMPHDATCHTTSTRQRGTTQHARHGTTRGLGGLARRLRQHGDLPHNSLAIISCVIMFAWPKRDCCAVVAPGCCATGPLHTALCLSSKPGATPLPHRGHRDAGGADMVAGGYPNMVWARSGLVRGNTSKATWCRDVDDDWCVGNRSVVNSLTFFFFL